MKTFDFIYTSNVVVTFVLEEESLNKAPYIVIYDVAEPLEVVPSQKNHCYNEYAEWHMVLGEKHLSVFC